MIKIKLGGKAFQVVPLALGPDDRWRQQYAAVLEPLGALAQMAIAKGKSAPDVALTAISAPGMARPMLMLDALIAYAPALAEERAWIEEHVYGMELVEALSELFFMGAMSMSPPNGAAPAAPQTTSPN